MADISNEQKEQETLRNLTKNSIQKINENLYMVNYQNEYYLDELLNEGAKSQTEVKSFVEKKFGINLDFNKEPTSKHDSCSSFNVYNKNNNNLLARNFDLPFLSPCFVVWTQPKGGYKSISFVSGIYIGFSEGKEITDKIKDRILYSIFDIIDGVNEAGLALCIHRLKDTPSIHQNDPAKKNLTASILMKGALDYCKNVNEAIQFFNKYNLHDLVDGSSYHYLFVDAQGDSAIIEYIDNKMHIIRPYEIEKMGYLFLTNFFLLKPIGKGNENGFDRYSILKKNLNDKTKMEESEAMNLLNKVHKASTIWSNVYNCNNLTVITSLRQNYNVLYKFALGNPNKCEIISKKNESDEK